MTIYISVLCHFKSTFLKINERGMGGPSKVRKDSINQQLTEYAYQSPRVTKLSDISMSRRGLGFNGGRS